VDLEDVLSIGELVVRIERAYAASLKGKLRNAQPHLRAIFKALTANEKRVMIALANLPGSPREQANAAVVGLNQGEDGD
jgi:hypothetical protein